MSPILFVIGIEPPAFSVRPQEKIVGISVKNSHSKITLFADDLLVTITNPKESLIMLDSLLSSFGKISRLIINQSKTLLYPINIPETIRLEL